VIDFGEFEYVCGLDAMDSVKDVLGKWGKKAAEATNKAQDLAGNMWQHCKFVPSINFFGFANNCFMVIIV